MPDLPLVPNNTNDSHVRSKRRRLSNGEAIMCSNTLRSISGDAGIRDMEMVLQFTDNTELRFQNISTNITEYARTMANHLNVNYIEAAPATSLIKSILQNNEKTIDERVEELYELSRQLPYWNSHFVTSNITIILIIVRRSPKLKYLIYWQILQCCILIQYLLSIGFIPMQHQIERTVLFSNGDSRHDILNSVAFLNVLVSVIKNRNRPMIIVLPRTLTLGLSADEIELVILWFTKINERIRIVSADSPCMNLLDVARANELVHTNSLSCGTSSHVNPLPTPTTPEQVAIEEQATSILRDGIAPDIQRHLIAGFLPDEDEVDDLNKLRRTLLSINQEIRASGVPLTDIDRLSDMMTEIVKRRFPNILCHSSDSPPCNVIALRTSPNGSSESTFRRVRIGNTDSDDQINNDIIDHNDDKEVTIKSTMTSLTRMMMMTMTMRKMMMK